MVVKLRLWTRGLESMSCAVNGVARLSTNPARQSDFHMALHCTRHLRRIARLSQRRELFLRSLRDSNRLVDIGVLWREFLGFEQFDKPILHVAGMAVDQPEVFMQLRPGMAVPAKPQTLFQLSDGLGPIMRGGGRQ